jgi:hypothetical protein
MGTMCPTASCGPRKPARSTRLRCFFGGRDPPAVVDSTFHSINVHNVHYVHEALSAIEAWSAQPID